MSGNHSKRKWRIYLIIFVEVLAFILGCCAFLLDVHSIEYYAASMGLLILTICFFIDCETSTGEAVIFFRLFIFLILYGFFSALFPALLASKALPSSWQWPIAGEMQALVLKSGQKAVVLKSVPRVQIYDADNQYLRGWFVPVTIGSAPRLVGNAEEEFGLEGHEMILVEVHLDDKEIIFTPEGQIVLEQPIGRQGSSDRPKTGNFETISFKSSWYVQPLCDPFSAWRWVVAGLLGLAILGILGLLSGADQGKDDEGKKHLCKN